uniref:non-specific serine/threonine protein kinase n=1 Tax=Gouania willdenowi TaxID=441366 RepID=A0A8C5EXU2_GOUWI
MKEKLLGEGGFSQVYAGERRSTSTPVAIKHISKKDVECSSWSRRPVVSLCKPRRDWPHGRLSPGDGGDYRHGTTAGHSGRDRLLFEVNHIPEDQVKVIFKQITNTALLMHKNGVFHRDLKPENFLVNRSKGTPEIRVIDFGCGDFVENEPFSRFYGTPEYGPPEHICGETYMAEATTIWQIGVMLHMTCTRVNFDTSVYMKKDKEVLKNVSKECNDFLSQCLALDPNQRPTLEDLLLHPWLE